MHFRGLPADYDYRRYDWGGLKLFLGGLLDEHEAAAAAVGPGQGAVALGATATPWRIPPPSEHWAGPRYMNPLGLFDAPADADGQRLTMTDSGGRDKTGRALARTQELIAEAVNVPRETVR